MTLCIRDRRWIAGAAGVRGADGRRGDRRRPHRAHRRLDARGRPTSTSSTRCKTVGIDLRRSTFWVGDERCVDPDDDRSNYKMIKESLLDPLGPDNQPVMHRMKGELGPQRGAEDY